MSIRISRTFRFWFVPAAILALVAAVVDTSLLGPVLVIGRAAVLKLTGRGTVCTWERIFQVYRSTAEFAHLRERIRGEIEILERDDKGFVKITSPFGPFWIRDEKVGSGFEYLFAEHRWDQDTNAEGLVRKGDVVIDVGAHVGVFVATALGRGAERVIAVEPDPRNVECLRRNFQPLIDAGRVTVVAEGAWSAASVLQLHLGESSAWNSFMNDPHQGSIEVPVRPLDDIVENLGFERVDYIKMDIEGAEREALKGARKLLSRDHPTVMMDSHQLPDDMEVLPNLVLSVDPGYRMICGACQFEHGLLVPHVTFYQFGEGTLAHNR